MDGSFVQKRVFMKKLVFIAAVIAVCSITFGFAQKIYSEDADYKADIKVYVTDADYKADLLVYKEDADYKATGNEGKWYFVDAGYKADKKLFFVDADYKADLKIYFVDAEYKAGWKNRSKMQLLY